MDGGVKRRGRGKTEGGSFILVKWAAVSWRAGSAEEIVFSLV